MRATVGTSAGFTIIELIVGMVVFGIVLAAVLPAVVDITRGAKHSTSRAAVNIDAAIITSQLENELHRARAPLASGATVRDGEQNSIWELAQPDPRYHDVIWASRVGLAFWSDVVSTPGAAAVTVSNPDGDGAFGSELVTYYLWYPGTTIDPPATPPDNASIDVTSGCPQVPVARWCLFRQVKLGASMPSAIDTTLTEVLASGIADDPSNPFPSDNSCLVPDNDTDVVRVFCYRWVQPLNDVGTFGSSYRFDRWSDRCRTRPNGAYSDSTLEPAGSPFNSASASWGAGVIAVGHPKLTDVRADASDAGLSRAGSFVSSPIYSLDRIAIVGVVLPSASAFGSDGDDGSTTSTITMRNRQTSDYLRAVVCGRR